MHDLIIVGGSVAGLSLARQLPELNILMLEDGQIGKPVQCSGLYSTNIEKFIPKNALEEMTEHTVSSAILHSPSGKTITLKKDKTAAYVINREKLDLFLRKQCTGEVKENEKCTGVSFFADRVEVATQKAVYAAKMVSGCDGPRSIIGRTLGAAPKETINGIIAITREKNTDPFVELWFDKLLLKDGFFWKVPRGNSCEYGAFSSDATYAKLETFFSINNYEKRAGVIPFGPPQTVFDRAILIGDAAAQVKPWSGGGVVYAMTAAEIAAGVIKKAVKENNFSEKTLSAYEQQWKKSFGKKIALGMRGRGLFQKMSNGQIDRLFAVAQKLPLNSLDMDFPDLGFAQKLLPFFRKA